MLDEPTAGVNPALKESLLDHIRELRDEGLSVLFVEHDMDVVMGISDWVVCMAHGGVIAERPAPVDRDQRGRHRRVPGHEAESHRMNGEPIRDDPLLEATGPRRRLPARRRHPHRVQPLARATGRSSA